LIITIPSSDDCRYEFEVDQQLQRALAALRAASIRTLGGDRFMDGTPFIVLARDSDGPAALEALEQLGIRALELKPLSDPDGRKPSRSVMTSR